MTYNLISCSLVGEDTKLGTLFCALVLLTPGAKLSHRARVIKKRPKIKSKTLASGLGAQILSHHYYFAIFWQQRVEDVRQQNTQCQENL